MDFSQLEGVGETLYQHTNRMDSDRSRQAEGRPDTRERRKSSLGKRRVLIFVPAGTETDKTTRAFI